MMATVFSSGRLKDSFLPQQSHDPCGRESDNVISIGLTRGIGALYPLGPPRFNLFRMCNASSLNRLVFVEEIQSLCCSINSLIYYCINFANCLTSMRLYGYNIQNLLIALKFITKANIILIKNLS